MSVPVGTTPCLNLAVLFQVADISGTVKTLSDMEDEIATLKNLLKETRKVNKRLKNQNRRQKQVMYKFNRFPLVQIFSLKKCFNITLVSLDFRQGNITYQSRCS